MLRTSSRPRGDAARRGATPPPSTRARTRARAARLATLLLLPFAGTALAWTTVPLDTEADGYRAREGTIAPATDIEVDAATAAEGIVVGDVPALAAAGAALRGKAAADADGLEPRSRGGYGYGDEVWVADVGVLLYDDRDGDGFFGAFALTLDVDTGGVTRDVYARIDLVDRYGSLTLSHDTAVFTVRGAARSDEYRIEIELLDGHPAGYEDVNVEIVDAYDGTLLDRVSAYELSSLGGLPLETERRRDDSYDYLDDGYYHGDDRYYDDGYGYYSYGYSYLGATSYTGGSYVAGYAAGATAPGGALALVAFALLRRRLRRRPGVPPVA